MLEFICVLFWCPINFYIVTYLYFSKFTSFFIQFPVINTNAKMNIRHPHVIQFVDNKCWRLILEPFHVKKTGYMFHCIYRIWSSFNISAFYRFSNLNIFKFKKDVIVTTSSEDIVLSKTHLIHVYSRNVKGETKINQ